jgi:hypothetical protein
VALEEGREALNRMALAHNREQLAAYSRRIAEAVARERAEDEVARARARAQREGYGA